MSKLKRQYQRIKQSGLDRLFIHPADIYPLVDQFANKCAANDGPFFVDQVGSSYLEKPIYKIAVGSGPINILLWSQMHGNEPTATASLFDFINYTMSPEHKAWFDSWRNKLTLHIVPMLNPDGAALEQRVNAQGIDINRDAKALQSPEGQLLMALAEELKPQFGFNLHSQNRFYTVGQTSNSAIISLLAPAYSEANETNESRKKAKQVASIINQALTQQYPGNIGRYDDTFSPRSFGDLFSAKGISTILIEAGFYKNDQHRQIPRWLTFLALVESISAIENESYKKEPLDSYYAIPFNADDGLVDVLLKNVSMDGGYQVDISINYDECFRKGTIDAIGDLSTLAGFCTKDMQGYQLQVMKGFQIVEAMTLSTESYLDLIRKGYGYFLGDETLLKIDTHLPVVLNPQCINDIMQLNHSANFLFAKNGKIGLAILEGLLVELEAAADS